LNLRDYPIIQLQNYPMTTNIIADLISHMEWADAQIWKVALDIPTLQTDQWMRERLLHFHATQWVYGPIIKGLPYKMPEADEYPDLKSIGLWARRFYKEIAPDLAKLNDAELQRIVEFPWADRLRKHYANFGPVSVEESILQLVLHTMHHRSQVAMRLREAGGKPPTIDYIAWIWLGRPAPDWGILETA
jgi:uncharacterized damage-inducible protein DinB